MSKQSDLSEIRATLREHEKRITALESRKASKRKRETKSWYRPGSTVHKVVNFVEVGFFDHPRSLKEIVSELKTRDYHFNSSDLTLPLRRIVHKQILKRTKINADGSPSKHWLFVRV